MTDFRIALDRTGKATLAGPEVFPGAKLNGSVVYDVVDCPPGIMDQDVIALTTGFRPPAGATEIPYGRLLARRNGSCCGGMCG
ncbi:hypothetical protein [Azospirillum sp. SYSU D00513]|uniref:hypothetical protein n=1 Tax=Azospirillum sp. SYSU D00513 TaxID=2812561 RepID=UPI001A95F937|nr:hypothetical protein [Azospirillum sp. SYSU D00513]